MFCPECGQEIPDHSKFCLNCGFKLETFKTPPKDLKEKISTQELAGTKFPIQQSNTSKGSCYLTWIILIIILISIVYINRSSTNEPNIENTHSEQIQTITEKLDQFEQGDVGTYEYYVNYAAKINELRTQSGVTEIVEHHRRVLSQRVAPFINDKYDDYLLAYDTSNISINNLTQQIRNVIGFDYNNLDMTDDQVVSLDFNGIRETFDSVASEYLEMIDIPLNEILRIEGLLIYSNVDEATCASVETEFNRLNEINLKINSIRNLLFSTLQSRQARIIRERVRVAISQAKDRIKNQYENRYFGRGLYQYEIEQKMAGDGFTQIDSYFCEAPDGSNQVKQEFEKYVEEDGRTYKVKITLQPSYGLGMYYHTVSVTITG